MEAGRLHFETEAKVGLQTGVQPEQDGVGCTEREPQSPPRELFDGLQSSDEVSVPALKVWTPDAHCATYDERRALQQASSKVLHVARFTKRTPEAMTISHTLLHFKPPYITTQYRIEYRADCAGLGH